MSATRAGATPGETAIVVPVDLPIAVRRLRDRFDPAAARGVPAHVTLLYPFMPPGQLTEEVRGQVAAVVATEPSFSFSLARMGRWPNVVWLAPEPPEPFLRLARALMQAFPEHPPYGGAHEDVVPHLTIAQDERLDWLVAAERALPALLPIPDVAREAQLMVMDQSGRWSTFWRMPLGRRG